MANPLMEIAWRDFVLWAASNKEIVAEFNAATGHSFMAAPKSGLDVMIDEATGQLAGEAKAFTLWVTEHHWGIDEAPDTVQAELRPTPPVAGSGAEG